jgi:hypothetical protein
MKTVVYQSYRDHEVPPWITRCLESVKNWTQAKGFEYRFLGDEFLGRPDASYLEKVDSNVLLTSDLARLLVARDLLSAGYERTIWVDADVFVFDPEHLEINITSEYAFCNEIWMERTAWPSRIWQLLSRGSWRLFNYEKRVNNAVCVFVAGNSLLDFYIHAAERVIAVRHPSLITPWLVGVGLLTRLNSAIKLPLLYTIGQLSPLLLDAICNCRCEILSGFARHLKHPIYAANLCSSFARQGYQGIRLTDAQYSAALNVLAQSRGNVINSLIRSA